MQVYNVLLCLDLLKNKTKQCLLRSGSECFALKKTLPSCRYIGLLYYYDVNCCVRLWMRILNGGGDEGKNTMADREYCKSFAI